MNSTLILVLVTLAIIALVLVVVAAKLVKGASKTSAAPTPPPSFVPVEKAPDPAPSKPVTQPPKPVPVPKRADGETESFDISAKNNHVLWCCPCCGTENSSGSRCMVCAQSRS